jgi:hypothetical protein
VEQAALHAPATVTTWPVTWPAAVGEASQTIARAMSSASATLRSAMVAVTRSTTAGSRSSAVIGVTVHPGATTLTRAFGASRTTSFFSDSIRPWAMPAFAAA